MKRRHFWFTLLGIVAGMGGSYLAAKAYYRARESCPPFSRRIYTSVREMINAFAELWRHPEDLHALRENPRLDPRLAAKISLAVTSMNGCQTCTKAHARYAQRLGLPREGVASLLRGEVSFATVDEATALFFAQNYATRLGEPDRDMVNRLVESYGTSTAHDIVTLVRVVTLGNLVGNTLDAFLSRLLGQPAPGSSFRGELAVVVAFSLGIMPLLPALAWRVVCLE